MRTKIRTTKDVKPGMVIRSQGVDASGIDMTVFRQVAKVHKLSIYSTAVITFTDGTRADVGYGREFQIARSKARRNAAKARVGRPAWNGVESALTLIGAYVRAA